MDLVSGRVSMGTRILVSGERARSKVMECTSGRMEIDMRVTLSMIKGKAKVYTFLQIVETNMKDHLKMAIFTV